LAILGLAILGLAILGLAILGLAILGLAILALARAPPSPAPAGEKRLSSYTQVYSVIYDSVSVPRRAIFSAKGRDTEMSERNSSTSAVFFADYSQVDAVDSRYRGTSLIRRRTPPPKKHRRTLGIAPL
jgi:hypothetical protein